MPKHWQFHAVLKDTGNRFNELGSGHSELLRALQTQDLRIERLARQSVVQLNCLFEAAAAVLLPLPFSSGQHSFRSKQQAYDHMTSIY